MGDIPPTWFKRKLYPKVKISAFSFTFWLIKFIFDVRENYLHNLIFFPPPEAILIYLLIFFCWIKRKFHEQTKEENIVGIRTTFIPWHQIKLGSYEMQISPSQLHKRTHLTVLVTTKLQSAWDHLYLVLTSLLYSL